MKRLFIILLAALCVVPAGAKAKIKTVKCDRKAESTFAIFTDSATYDSCGTAILKYRDVLQKEGLGTYIFIADWDSPEQVKKTILDIYGKKPALEGVVFIGKIPVVRVQGGQYLTTAFKMNEKKYSRWDASVTSDRFYDDFGLQFDYLSRDTTNSNIFYYRLNENGDQKISSDIYSGRILVPEDLPGSRAAILNDYLERVVAAHEETNPLDHIIFYAGAGYNSDDLNLWREKPLLFREYFPMAFRRASGNRFYDFRQNYNIVRKLFTEIQRPETDVFFFSEHGDYDIQYITDPEREEDLRSNIDYYYRSDSITKNSRINIYLDDIDSLDSGARLMVFNACYNGSFHEGGYVAVHHIFNGGRCIAAQGNTVNVLQDKWEDQLYGMLSLGFRLGQWQKEYPYLESHLIGDPTYRFTPVVFNVNRDSLRDSRYCSRLMQDKDPRIAAYGVRMFAKCAPSGETLLAVLRESPFASVRLLALNELYSLADPYPLDAVKYALMNDPAEEVRRMAARYAGFIGDTSLVEPLIRTMLYDEQSKRVAYDAATSVQVYPHPVVDSCIARIERSKRFIPLEGNTPDDFSALIEDFDYLELCAAQAVDKSLPVVKRISAIRTTRNYNLHTEAARFAEVVCDPTDSLEVRLCMAEALGWYNHSVYRGEIVKAFDRCLASSGNNLPDELAAEMKKTIKRLSAPTH